MLNYQYHSIGQKLLTNNVLLIKCDFLNIKLFKY